MAFTLERSSHELIVRQRAAGLPLLLGAGIYAVAAWLLLGESEIADGARNLKGPLPWLLNLSILMTGAMLAWVGAVTLRYPVELVLDRARNTIRIRYHPGTARLDFHGRLHEVKSFDLVDVETAVYNSLVRAAKQTPSWLNAFSGVKEWAFRGVSAEAQFDAKRSLAVRFSRLEPVRLRVTMQDGEEIMLDRLNAAPARMQALAQSLEEFLQGAP